MVGGEYRYDPAMKGHAHLWNQGRARKAMAAGTTPIVIDNTNLVWSDISPYAKMARENGYEVSYAEPDTPWKFDVDELFKRNTHGVPRDAIQRMLDRWQPTETLGTSRTASAAIDTAGFAGSGRHMNTHSQRERFKNKMNSSCFPRLSST